MLQDNCVSSLVWPFGLVSFTVGEGKMSLRAILPLFSLSVRSLRVSSGPSYYLGWFYLFPFTSYFSRSKFRPLHTNSLILHPGVSKPIPIDSPYPI